MKNQIFLAIKNPIIKMIVFINAGKKSKWFKIKIKIIVVLKY